VLSAEQEDSKDMILEMVRRILEHIVVAMSLAPDIASLAVNDRIFLLLGVYQK